ncbi:hypothetical protein GIB67_013195 [Kingdonia uniflora]|uniref:Small ribosomal subunit protein uS3 C-terminal domain-containing protein n=1 Tax=Kingdonia uniflora TaxID=39325 RepID=A0A7J7NQM4_9MAGN|nr:hypothetical protein GIB67_013195 [Kingdonia uniflora]
MKKDPKLRDEKSYKRKSANDRPIHKQGYGLTRTPKRDSDLNKAAMMKSAGALLLGIGAWCVAGLLFQAIVGERNARTKPVGAETRTKADSLTTLPFFSPSGPNSWRHLGLVAKTLPYAQKDWGALHYFAMQYFFQTSKKMHFDPVYVLQHFAASGCPSFLDRLRHRGRHSHSSDDGTFSLPPCEEPRDLRTKKGSRRILSSLEKSHLKQCNRRSLKEYRGWKLKALATTFYRQPYVLLKTVILSPDYKRGALNEKIVRSCIAFFVESYGERKKKSRPSLPGAESGGVLKKGQSRLTHQIQRFFEVGTSKTKISLFPFFGATFFFPRDGCMGGLFHKLVFKKKKREQLLGQCRTKSWNLLGKERVVELIEKLLTSRESETRREWRKGIEILTEIIVRNRRIPYGYNSYLNKEEELLSMRTNTLTKISSVNISSVYQSAALIAQDISFQLKTRSFRAILSQIVKEIPRAMPSGCAIEGIRICCSGRSEGAEIARTECGKYGKTSRNVFHQKIDYASATVSTRHGILGVKVWISVRKFQH